MDNILQQPPRPLLRPLKPRIEHPRQQLRRIGVIIVEDGPVPAFLPAHGHGLLE